MNGFGEPNMGKPSVRFDEGRESVGHWPVPFNPTSPAYSNIPAVPGGEARHFLPRMAEFRLVRWGAQPIE